MTAPAEVAAAARAARLRIGAHLRPTGVERWGPLLVKAEHRQHTGSFKVRGALAALSAHPGVPVVAASSGNHGLGVAHALTVLGGEGQVVVPRGASPRKVGAIAALGVEVREVDGDGLAAELAGRELARRTGARYLSPYNDPDVVAGQATIALELVEQVADHGWAPPDEVVVAVGGGGLIAGIASVLAQAWPGTAVVGASPAADAAMAASVAAGRIVTVDAAPTLSDGTAGGVEPGAITLALCTELVDAWCLVDEADIARAMREAARSHDVVEGAAAVALAAARRRVRDGAGSVLAVSCGGNVAPEVLERVRAG
ncbi:MAG: pyridoxal-phosphate dependent enzyme [Kineosporiaceae bacterium]